MERRLSSDPEPASTPRAAETGRHVALLPRLRRPVEPGSHPGVWRNIVYKMGRFAWRLRGCLLGSGPGSRTGYPGLHGHQHLNPSRSGCGKEDEGAVNRLDSALWDSSRLPIIPLASGSAAPMISPPKATWDVTPPLVVGPLPPPRHWRLPGGHSSCLSPFPSEPLDGAVGPRGWDSS